MIKISSKIIFFSLCCYLAYIMHNILLQEPNLKKCLEFLCNDVMNSFNAKFFSKLELYLFIQLTSGIVIIATKNNVFHLA